MMMIPSPKKNARLIVSNFKVNFFLDKFISMWVKSDLKDLIKKICGRISCYFQRLQGYGKGLGQHCNARPKKPQSNGVMQIIVYKPSSPCLLVLG